MSTDFLHGVEVVTVAAGPKPITTVSSSVIGVIGTAPDATDVAFPLDTPVLVNSRGGMANLGASGTLPDAISGILDQFGAAIVVVRVAASTNVDPTQAWAETVSNIVGGIDPDTGDYKGVQAFRKAQSLLGLSPMILIAPTFTGERPQGVTAIPVTAGGDGYQSAPAVSFTGGTGTGATAHAVLGTGANAGQVVSIVMDSGGRYTAAPTAALVGGSPTDPATLGAVTLGASPNPTVNAMLSVANMLRAHIFAEGPDTIDSDAIAYASDFGSRRVYLVDPSVKVWDTTTSAYVTQPNSPRVAGLMAQVDNNLGFWWSPSNQTVNNIGGTGRPVDFAMGDPSARANILNSANVATFINDDGWRLWGNRTLSSDPTFAFLSVSRTADMIDLSIMKAHRWAVDRPMNKNYFDDVTAAVNAYMRSLQARGAILGGSCWVDPDLNTADQISAGHATFSYDFTPPTPAERVTFQSSITDDYISSIFANS